jgi:hypothetical protein
MYNFNLKRLVLSILPVSLRSGNFKYFLFALNGQFKTVFLSFTSFRLKQLKNLTYSCQYPYLQKLLNNKFDNLQRRIKVSDGNFQEPILVYPQEDQIPLILPFIVYPAENYNFPPFLVKIPAAFQNNINMLNQLKRYLNIYKFPGTKYTITFI